MLNRRSFQKTLLGLSAGTLFSSCKKTKSSSKFSSDGIIISTWNNQKANSIAYNFLNKNPDQLMTAIEKGINSVESDPNDTSVGYGGFPDRNGDVTLDACLMDHTGNAGAVTYLQKVKHPISVARKVMDDTPHVILSGQGAQDFAVENGFPLEDLRTEKSIEEYEKWLEKSEYRPKINVERHDTIGMIGKDVNGNLSGGCSTSGLAFKMGGRVGDSPIIGAGLFVDNEIGAAVATGLGELVLKTCSTFLVVEFMRSGHSPQMACKMAIERIIAKAETKDAQVGLIAIDKAGNYGGYSIHKGFNFAISSPKGSELVESQSYND